MIDFNKRNDKKYYKTFEIDMRNGFVQDISQAEDNKEIYAQKNGFYRRANVSDFQERARPAYGKTFEDPDFQANFSNTKDSYGNAYKTRRLWDSYEQEVDIFKNFSKDTESFIDYRKSYCSFATEFGLIDKLYLQSIFITRKINKEGYYEYFVRRDGQYHIGYIDDTIPVEGMKLLPIWGLSYSCPWELLLLKAWIKQKGSIFKVLNAEPFEFLYAFGLPGYSAKNIKRQLNFLKRENSDEEKKKRKVQRLPLNNSVFNVLAKTRNDERIEELGLVKNCLGYKVTPIQPSKSMISHKSEQKTFYLVHSTVPAKWIGSLSVVNSKEQSGFDFSRHVVNLEKQFIATQEEVLAIFSKYYIARDYNIDYENNNIYQDSYIVRETEEYKNQVFELKVHENGIMNINIDLMDKYARKQHIKGTDQIRYPYIKYFLSKKTNTKSNISEEKGERGLPGQFEPNLFSFEYYDIEFVKGYHRSCNRFLNIEKGTYYMYIQIENFNSTGSVMDYSINVSASAKFDQLQQLSLNLFEMRQLVDSTIFQYAKIHGEKYIKDNTGHFYIGNCFRQIGFGFLACEVREQSPGKNLEKGAKKRSVIGGQIADLGIKIIPENMKKLSLAAYYGTQSGIGQNRPSVSMIARLNYPKIIVFENKGYNFELREQFPQQNSIEIFNMKKKKY